MKTKSSFLAIALGFFALAQIPALADRASLIVDPSTGVVQAPVTASGSTNNAPLSFPNGISITGAAITSGTARTLTVKPDKEKVLILSEYGLLDDSAVTFGVTEGTSGSVQGTIQTAKIQAILNSATTAPLHIINDCRIATGPLLFYSNTTWENLPGCGLIELQSSTAPLITNAHHVAISGSEIDHDIAFIGGIFNGNAGTGTTSSWQPAYWTASDGTTHYVAALTWFIGVDRLTFDKTSLYESASSCIHCINVNGFIGSDNTLNTGDSPNYGDHWRDGFHFNGPSSYIDIHGNNISANDDKWAINSDDVTSGTSGGIVFPGNFSTDGGNGGPITHVKIHDDVISGSTTMNTDGLRIQSGTNLVDDVEFYAISGSVRSFVVSICATNFPSFSGFNFNAVGPGVIGAVSIHNTSVNPAPGGTDAYLQIESNAQNINFSDNNFPAVNGFNTYSVVDLSGYNVNTLTVENNKLDESASSTGATPASFAIINGTAGTVIFKNNVFKASQAQQQRTFIYLTSINPVTSGVSGTANIGSLIIDGNDIQGDPILSDTAQAMGSSGTGVIVGTLVAQNNHFTPAYGGTNNTSTAAFYSGSTIYSHVYGSNNTSAIGNSALWSTGTGGSFSFLPTNITGTSLNFVTPSGTQTVTVIAGGTAVTQAGPGFVIAGGTLSLTGTLANNMTLQGIDNSAPNQFTLTGTALPTDVNMLITQRMANLLGPTQNTWLIWLNMYNHNGSGGAAAIGGYDALLTTGTAASGAGYCYSQGQISMAEIGGTLGSASGHVDWRKPTAWQQNFASTTALVSTGSMITSVACATSGISGPVDEGSSYGLFFNSGSTAAVKGIGIHSGTTTTSGTLATVQFDTNVVLHSVFTLSTGTVGDGECYMWVDGIFSGSYSGGPQSFSTADTVYSTSTIFNGTNSGTNEAIQIGPIKFGQ